MTRTARLPLLVLTALSLVPTAASAQGMLDATTNATVPHSQVAASDDAFSLYVNPAGIASVDALQLVAGYTGSYFGERHDHFQGGAALRLLDGLAIGGAGGLVLTPLAVRTPFVYGALTGALALGRSLSLGATARATLDTVPNARGLWTFDLGGQWRLARWLAAGATFENLGAPTFPESSLRAGLAIRPFTDHITIGTDVRMRPGNEPVFSPAFYSQGTLDWAATARVHLGGLALTLGGIVENALSETERGFLVNAGLQVDTSHLGAVLLGGWDTSSTLSTGVLARASIERYQSIWPAGGRWLSFTLVGDGRLDDAPGTLLEELLASPPHPAIVLASLQKAATDPDVAGVVLRLKRLDLGWGRIAELRDALLTLRDAEKHVVVHMDGGADPEVFLASAADRVYLTPAGALDLDGLHVTLTYLADLLQQLGIRPEAIAAGGYKTAPRTFTDSEPSDEELEVQNDILDLVYARMVEAIAAGRKLTADEVRAIIERGPISSDDALEAGIIDGLAYWDELPRRLEELAGRVPRLDETYLDDLRRTVRWNDPPQIAIVPVVGQIVQGRTEPGLFNLFGQTVGADDVVDALNKAKDNRDIKAVILRIDSPGGDALASDLIWRAVMELRQVKPVIASMGDLAASGGYYVAAGAQEIYAEPQTLTGSIGVFSLLFTAEELTDELGVRAYELSRGGSPPPTLFRPLSDEQREKLEEQVDWVYRRFLNAIVEGRSMKLDEVAEVAEGRVWTGLQAKERGLVDHLGGLAMALRRAQELGGVAEEDLEISILSGNGEIFPRLGTAVRTLLGVDDTSEELRAAMEMLVGDPAALRLLQQGTRPMALTPGHIEVR